MDTNWKEITSKDFDQLKKARIQLHKYVQLVASTGRSYYPKDPGDAHGSLTYESGIFLGKVLMDGSRFGLHVSDFSLVNISEQGTDNFPLENKSIDDAEQWIKTRLSNSGFNPLQYDLKLPYEIPDYGPSSIKAKVIASEYYREISNQFTNASSLLTKISGTLSNSSGVVCWPHHFDIATLITLEQGSSAEDSKSIGIGLSPGDDNFDQPYYYLTPWPYPKASEIEHMNLEAGFWHTDGWIGAILTTEEIISKPGSAQGALVSRFIDQSYSHLIDTIL